MKQQRHIYCIVVALLTGATCLHAAEPTELTTLRTRRDEMGAQIQREAQAKTNRLNEQYVEALDSLIQRLTLAGQLDAAHAVREEKNMHLPQLGVERGIQKTDTIAHPNRPQEGQDWTSPTTGTEFVWISQVRMWVGKYEVTNAEYRKKEPSHNSGSYLRHSLNGDRQPVVHVDFDDAKAYAAWLTQKDRAVLGGALYRLPSEQEWTIFVQCGDGREYPWGNNWPPLSGQAGNYHGQEGAGRWGKIRGYNDGFPVTAPVDQLWRNPWGLYGVGGNVWEACARDSSGGSFGAWRGASWRTNGQDGQRVSHRSDAPDGSIRDNGEGFRLVLSVGVEQASVPQAQDTTVPPTRPSAPPVSSRGGGGRISTTVLSGTQTADVWEVGPGIHQLEGIYTVLAHQQLIIDAGSVIVASRDACISIAGALKIRGTKDKPVTIRGERESPGFWLGIRLNSANNSTIEFTHILGAQTGLTISSSENVTVTSTIIARGNTGISLQSRSRVTFDNCLITENRENGITDHHTTSFINNSTISNNRGWGYASSYYGSPRFDSSVITQNGNGGITVGRAAYSTYSQAHNSVITGNGGPCVVHRGTRDWDYSRNWWGTENTRRLISQGDSVNLGCIEDFHNNPQHGRVLIHEFLRREPQNVGSNLVLR